jgi:hypothetical protein
VAAVAGSRPRAAAVNVAVGNGHAARGASAEDDVLATDLGGCDVVDPDKVGVVNGDGITTPDVARVCPSLA